MVQVIRGGSGLSREEAFQRGMDRMASGASSFGQAMSRQDALGRQEAATGRQQGLEALKFQTGLAGEGVEVSPEESQAIQSAFKSGDFSGLGTVLEKQSGAIRGERASKAETQKAERDLSRRFKEAQIQSLSQKSKEVKKPKMATPKQFEAAGFAKRARMAEQELKSVPRDVGAAWHSTFDPFVPEAFKGEDVKAFEQSKRNFVSAVLRRESGAAIPESEMKQEELKYFRQPGDTPRIIAQKTRAREQAMANLEAEGSPAMGEIATVDVPEYVPGESAAQKGLAMFGDVAGQAAMPSAQAAPAAHPQASEAEQWARQNPNDPRAQDILQRLGGQ